MDINAKFTRPSTAKAYQERVRYSDVRASLRLACKRLGLRVSARAHLHRKDNRASPPGYWASDYSNLSEIRRRMETSAHWYRATTSSQPRAIGTAGNECTGCLIARRFSLNRTSFTHSIPGTEYSEMFYRKLAFFGEIGAQENGVAVCFVGDRLSRFRDMGAMCAPVSALSKVMCIDVTRFR